MILPIEHAKAMAALGGLIAELPPDLYATAFCGLAGILVLMPAHNDCALAAHWPACCTENFA